jgi:DNA-binding transcriptional MerR regulator
MKVTFYREHRPLQAYVTALIDAGFSIEQWREITEEDQDDPRHRIPMFLDILATRLPRKETKAAPALEVKAAPVLKLVPQAGYYHG